MRGARGLKRPFTQRVPGPAEWPDPLRRVPRHEVRLRGLGNATPRRVAFIGALV
jgi:hypothetical protein